MVKRVRAQIKPPTQAIRLAPQEQAFLQLLRLKEDIVALIDTLRPKVILTKNISEYRRMIEGIRGEVYLEDLLRGLGVKGRVKVTY